MINSARKVARSKPRAPVAKQLKIVKEQLDDLRDYLELLEARIENRSGPTYSLDEVKKKLRIK